MESLGAHDAIRSLFRAESRRVLATLVRLLGDLDLAEEALQEAFTAALDQWPQSGLPENPRAWLVSTGRFKAIDTLRRRARGADALVSLAREQAVAAETIPEPEPVLEDDTLRLVFLCCHPSNPVESQVALTLREVCGLTTEEIAAAYLADTAAVAKRIVRAKARLRDERIPFEVPEEDVPARLDAALKVVYLVFNEGYSASSGQALVRAELSAEGIRLGRLLAELAPSGETLGLLALMVLQESRRAARESQGELVLLEDQDRSLWNASLIAEGLALVDQALLKRPGVYALQAAIAALHSQAARSKDTDWPQIAALYDLLLERAPSPVVALNRAVAVAFRDGAAEGLRLVDALLAAGALSDYHLAHSVRADFLSRLGRVDEARQSFEKALYHARQETERRFLHSRIRNLSKS